MARCEQDLFCPLGSARAISSMHTVSANISFLPQSSCLGGHFNGYCRQVPKAGRDHGPGRRRSASAARPWHAKTGMRYGACVATRRPSILSAIGFRQLCRARPPHRFHGSDPDLHRLEPTRFPDRQENSDDLSIMPCETIDANHLHAYCIWTKPVRTRRGEL